MEDEMKKVLFFVLTLSLLGGGLLFAAGGSAASGSSAAGSVTSTPVGQYPVVADVTLRYWMELDVNTSTNYTNLGETPFGRELQKQTGIKVNFEHPAGAVAEAFNLMIASSGRDTPDIVMYSWMNYVGGPEKAIADGIVLRLNDSIDKWSPHFKSFFKANPEYDRLIKSDEGSYYVYPFIRDGEVLLYSAGLMIRKDWLDELGLEPPQTIPDWYNVLVAFRDRKNITAPFTQTWGNRGSMFIPGFGILQGMHLDSQTGRVRYGQMQNGYRQWIETMAQWYREGLIDKDILTITTAQQNQKMISGGSGATYASVGSGMGVWTDAARPGNPKYEILSMPYPVLNRGERLVYTIPGRIYQGSGSSAIMKESRNYELAARFLDYGYTQPGIMLFNYGIEGESYTMVNGKPIYTPLVMSGGPNRWPLAQSLSAYIRATTSMPYVQHEGYIRQYYALPEQAQALINFVMPGAPSYLLPPTTPTQDESREYASIMQEINTYVDEKTVRWLLGTDPINDATWNDYVNNLRRMNIERAIAIQDLALDRFNKR